MPGRAMLSGPLPNLERSRAWRLSWPPRRLTRDGDDSKLVTSVNRRLAAYVVSAGGFLFCAWLFFSFSESSPPPPRAAPKPPVAAEPVPASEASPPLEVRKAAQELAIEP